MSETDRTSTSFGRIDADGTVYVRTASGERAVGSWQAGSAEEGLAHFARRYDDLATEVSLLQARLASGAADPQHTAASARKLRSSLDSVAAVGDLTALESQLDEVERQAEKSATEAKAARQEAREQAIAAKSALVSEAEKLADSTQWKTAGEHLQAIVDTWKTIHGVDRKTDAALWQQFAAARNTFNARRREHFAQLTAERKKTQGHKEQLIAEAEKLADSTDWQHTAARLKQLMLDWKAAGRAGREAEEKLWKRFRAAQDHFFSHRSEAFAARDAELTENLRKKEKLLADAEKIDPSSDKHAAQAKLRDVHARWDTLGHVPRNASHSLERRLRELEDNVRGAANEQWRREHAAENPLLTQMREQVDRASQQLERAKAGGDSSRIAAAQKALDSKRQFLELAERSA